MANRIPSKSLQKIVVRYSNSRDKKFQILSHHKKISLVLPIVSIMSDVGLVQ